MADPDYIVYRRHPEYTGTIGDLDGKWVDRSTIPLASNRGKLPPHLKQTEPLRAVVANPTGRFETNSDGSVAEVWEIGYPNG